MSPNWKFSLLRNSFKNFPRAFSHAKIERKYHKSKTVIFRKMNKYLKYFLDILLCWERFRTCFLTFVWLYIKKSCLKNYSLSMSSLAVIIVHPGAPSNNLSNCFKSNMLFSCLDENEELLAEWRQVYVIYFFRYLKCQIFHHEKFLRYLKHQNKMHLHCKYYYKWDFQDTGRK